MGLSGPPGNGGQDGFILYEHGSMMNLGTLGSYMTWVSAINDANTVVGASLVSGDIIHAYTYSDGTMTDLGTLGGYFSYAFGINDEGTIVGTSLDASDTDNYAFIDNNGTMTNLNTLVNLPGVSLMYGADINDVGQIVAEGSNNQAYLLTPVADDSPTATLLGVSIWGVMLFGRRLTRNRKFRRQNV